MKLIHAFTLGALAAISGFACAQKEIGPGNPAPALEVKKWYKGTPQTDISKGIVVVEFWATWCGPCKTSIPHLTEIAKKNPDVRIIGVSIWEENGGIPKFVEEMGDKMDYHVGWSSNQEGMAKSWMAASAQNGIPSSFIIKDGVIQWIGHPMELEKPLEEVKAGTFDVAAARKAFDLAALETRKQMALQAEIGAVMALRKEGKKAEAAAVLADLVKRNPEAADQARGIEFQWLATDNPKAWETKAVELSKAGAPGMQTLCSFSAQAAGQPATQKQARRAIDLVMEMAKPEDLMAFSYASYVYEKLGDKKQTLVAAKALLKAMPDTKEYADARAEVAKKIKDLEGA